MSDLEESLLDSDEEEEAPKPKRENSAIKQMREALEAKESRLKELEDRATRYEKQFIEQAGLTEKQAAVLKAGGYEATVEGIEAFRSEVLGVTQEAPEPTEQSEEVEEPEEEPFAPTPTSGTTAGGKREVTSEQLLDLMRTDPAKADKLLREGRVVRKQFDPGGPAF